MKFYSTLVFAATLLFTITAYASTESESEGVDIGSKDSHFLLFR